MPRYDIRLSLPDAPGSLAAIAAALGQAGVDIVSLEVIDTAGAVAVDRLLVDVDADIARDLPATLEQLDDVNVERLGPVATHRHVDGPLELIGDLADAGTDQVLPTLVDGLPIALHASWAAVVASREPQPLQLAASVGSPSLVGSRTPWLPLDGPTTLDIHDWVPQRWDLRPGRTAVAAAPLDASGDPAVLAVRHSGPAFRNRELRVLAGLALVAGRLTERPSSDDDRTDPSLS